MKRSKRLLVLLGVLAVVCIAAFAALRVDEYQEQISTSGETVLELDADTVEALSWDYDGTTLSFRRTDDGWQYDDDADFPVSSDAIDRLLDTFSKFSAAFVIEQVEDFGQYGLDEPVCTIRLETDEQTYEITLGDYSAMDEQRYVSLGDGSVYLAVSDPLPAYEATLHDLIDNDEPPFFDTVSQISFAGEADYTITYQEDSADTYREEDVYFAQEGGQTLPLDTERVQSYLDTLSLLDLTDYVTYTAGAEDLSAYGLDAPELTVQVTYTADDADGNESEQTFSLAVSRDPDDDAEDTDEITAYARVGESEIVYLIPGEDYEALLAAQTDDLRHTEVLPAALSQISRIDVTLDGSDYTLTAEQDDENVVFSYADEEIESDDLQTVLEALQADSFTDQEPDEKEEISLTCYLDLDGEPSVDIALYRYNGSFCLAEVDGDPVALVPRAAVVDLIEAVNAIVLN